MTIWLVLIAMTLVVVAVLIRPLLGKKAVPFARDLIDQAVLKDQLAEVDRDQSRELIGADEALAARLEISRRALAQDRKSQSSTQPAVMAPKLIGVALALVVLVPLAGVVLYTQLGTPQILSAAPGQDAAQDAAHAEMVRLVETLSAKMQARPDDQQGFRLLARSAMQVGRYDLALPAFRRAMELDQNKDTALVGDFAEALVMSERAVVPEARRAFDAVLSADPKDPRARYYLAEAQAEIGAWDVALEQWQGMLRDGGDQAEYAEVVRSRIADAAKRLGRDVKSLMPAAPSVPAAPPPAMTGSGGPSAQDVAQAAQMGAGDRQAMISGMVARLADKLKANPDDPAGWRKLARAYLVLGQMDQSLVAYEEAIKRDPKSAEALNGYVAALRQGPGINDPRYLPSVRRLLEVDHDNADALFAVGEVELRAGHIEQGRDYWTRLLAGWPKEAPQRKELVARMQALAAEAKIAPSTLGLPD